VGVRGKNGESYTVTWALPSAGLRGCEMLSGHRAPGKRCETSDAATIAKQRGGPRSARNREKRLFKIYLALAPVTGVGPTHHRKVIETQ
jgi:hypothetical protein